MSEPKEQQREPDELDLDAETVTDLDPSDDEAERIKGGSLINCQTREPQPR